MTREALEYAELEGARVLVRPVSVADAPAAFELVKGERRILQWLIWPGPEDEEELASYYASWAKRGAADVSYALALIDRASGLFAGGAGLKIVDGTGTGTLGYWLGVPFWGGGRVSEAVGLIGHLAFEHLGLELLSACVFEGNDASRRVLEKNGWTYDLPEPTRSCGEERSQWHLSLDRSTWAAAEERVRPVREDVRPTGAVREQPRGS